MKKKFKLSENKLHFKFMYHQIDLTDFKLLKMRLRLELQKSTDRYGGIIILTK